MKTKRFCKSTVSLLLVFMMLVSMLTVAIVNTSAAETDIAQTSAVDTKRIFFKNDWSWSDVRIYYTGTSNSGSWPGESMSYHSKDNGVDVYYYDIPSDATMMIFNGIKNDNSGVRDQTPDIKSITGEHCYYPKWDNGNSYGDFYKEVTYYLRGAFNNWADADLVNGVTLTLSAGTYEFQIKDNTNKYYKNNGTINDSTGSTPWKFEKSASSNCKLNATGGTYKFTFNRTTMKLTIEHTPTGGGGGDDGGDGTTEGTKRYYVGKRTFIDIDYIKVYESNGTETTINSGNIEFIDTETTIESDYAGNGTSTYNVYSFNLDSKYTHIIIHCYHNEHAQDNWSTSKYELNTNKIILLDEYSGFKEAQIDYTPTDAPTDVEIELEETKIIKFVDKTRSLAENDAKIFAHDKTNSKVYEMTKTIETYYGYDTWVATLEDTATTTTDFDFYRTSIFADTENLLALSESGTWWGKYTAGARGMNISFVATSSTEGMWSKSNYPVPAGTMTDFTYGLWVDTKGSGHFEDAVSWHKVSDTEYHLYLPSYAKDIETLNVYTSFYSAKLTGGYYDGHKLLRNAPNPVSFRNGTTTYTLKDGAFSYTLKVYKSDNVSSLLMNTNRELYTGTVMDALDSSTAWAKGEGFTGTDDERQNAIASEYKDAIETKGIYRYYDENGKRVNENTTLKKIKGRGNSTFKASMDIYGKYAYNITLGEKEQIISGATKSDKWCLLANNVDHTMMRNTFIYSVASDMGLKYAPKTQLVDVYNNGQYLGAYVITEKVEYGSGTLMNDLDNLDDANETASKNACDPKTPKKSATVTGTYSTASGDYSYQCKSFTGPTDFKKYNFLLEFELYDRYENEASWFISPRTGQAVVVKYPEYANVEQMEWIIDQYEAVESLVYTNTNASVETLSGLIDVDSFVKMYLIQELALNLDSCATSFYIHNQFTNADHTESVLYASPVWDYDWSMGAYTATWDSGKKYYYDSATGNTKVNTTTIDDPKQLFIKKKALRTDSEQTTYKDNFNLQAMLAQNTNFWGQCQLTYTNILVPTIDNYIYNKADIIDDVDGYDENDKMLYEWLPKFKSSVNMNNARWGALTFTGDTWGTKVTSKYSSFSADLSKKDLGIGATTVGSNSAKFDNTVYYLNDWLAIRWNYMSSTQSNTNDQLYLSEERYKINEDITFALTHNGHIVTITPYAEFQKNDIILDDSAVTVVVYVNGVAQPTKYTLADTINLTLEGGAHKIMLKAYPTAYEALVTESETKNVNVTYDGQPAEIEIRFKCSDSYRYTPTITCGDTSIEMTKIDEVIAKNDSTAQSYYWYTATVEAIWGQSFTVNFKNLLKMDATYTISEVRSELFYFAVDNMNTGTTVVDLTDVEPNIRNTCKSAVNMVENNPNAEGLAVTSFDGGYYVVGDTDLDDTLTIMDATLIQLALAKKTELSYTAEKLADFNLDSKLSINDVTGVQIYLAN